MNDGQKGDEMCGCSAVLRTATWVSREQYVARTSWERSLGWQLGGGLLGAVPACSVFTQIVIGPQETVSIPTLYTAEGVIYKA